MLKRTVVHFSAQVFHYENRVQTCYDKLFYAKIHRVALASSVFTALRAMQTRSSDENFVRLSVRPSVRHTREL